MVLETGKSQDHGTGRLGVWQRLSSLTTDDCLLGVSSHGRRREGALGDKSQWCGFTYITRSEMKLGAIREVELTPHAGAI